MEDQLGKEKRQYLHDLLDNSTYDDDRKRILHYIIDELVSNAQYEYVVRKLTMNGIQDKDRIAFGMNYNQSDINKTLKGK